MQILYYILVIGVSSCAKWIAYITGRWGLGGGGGGAPTGLIAPGATHPRYATALISEKRDTLKVPVIFVPLLNYMDKNRLYRCTAFLASCQNKLILILILKLAFRLHLLSYQAKASSFILHK
jgi:hypothetical protein